MWSRLVKQVAAPIVARLGAFATGALVAAGVPNDQTTALVAASGVCLGIAFDVAVILFAKRRAV